MTDLDILKKENEELKNQLAQNSEGAQNLFSQLEAHRGELTDSRTIALQLRVNIINASKYITSLQETNKDLQSKLDEANEKLKKLQEPKGK